MESLIGQTLGQYKIVEQIGEGGMATVFKAYQPGLNRDVALKILSPYIAKREGFTERFAREAQAIGNLHHPNILPVYDFGQDKGYGYIAMRYVAQATTLAGLMKNPLPMEQVIELTRQIAAALEHAHRAGIIHRDIKPSNILMDNDWVLLSDFGLAKMMETPSELTGSGVGVGTPAYMSPEQARGEQVDHRTDIYSLGIIVFEMLTGQIPHKA
ncbi:MAG: serine/threonine protein kinase, partial [Anaerolineae bacterium]|nr:serine/threonine protein kinase [Anaerolineae bacterium]